MDFNRVVETVGFAIDLAGVAVIVIGIVVAVGHFGLELRRGSTAERAYRQMRQSIGRTILLGLELLVAGDIIRTVAIEPTFSSVGVLAAIVLIRTFLSWSLEVELTGRWPWDRSARGSATTEEDRAPAEPGQPRAGSER